jgi:hypothetical protein
MFCFLRCSLLSKFSLVITTSAIAMGFYFIVPQTSFRISSNNSKILEFSISPHKLETTFSNEDNNRRELHSRNLINTQSSIRRGYADCWQSKEEISIPSMP